MSKTIKQINESINEFVVKRDCGQYRNKESISYRLRELVWQVEKLKENDKLLTLLTYLHSAQTILDQYIVESKNERT